MRIPFAEAIAEPRLLRNRFNELSLPQQVALKLLYGVPLSPHMVCDQTGFSEIDYWNIFHGACELDELGFPVRVVGSIPYAPQDFREAVLIMGRRAGKTDAFASTIVAYEATCGGHERYLRPRQVGLCFQIAQDLRMARNALHFIRAVLESSPFLKETIVQVTADRIDLNNNFCIASVPATLKSVRGFASPVSVMDEVGVWYQEAESANPDYEIYRALSPGQVQFPDRKIVAISSPWNKAGLLFQYYEAGTRGYKLPTPSMASEYAESLVISGPTAVMDNPLVDRQFLERERKRDPQAFEREFLARFQDSISGFLPSILVSEAVSTGVRERAHEAGRYYVAAMDPAFKRDAFGFTIMHAEKGTIVQDVVRRFIGDQNNPVTPGAVLELITPLLKKYGVSIVYSDQYHLESLGQLLRERSGCEIVGVTFTAKSKAQMYGNLQQLFLQKKIKLLDDYETVRELKSLERTLTAGGGVQIAAPPGMHDDMASVVCVAAAQLMYASESEATANTTTQSSGLDYHALIQAQIERKWAAVENMGAWD